MQSKGNILQIQLDNKKHIQPDTDFEFIDSILAAIIHADPDSTGVLDITASKVIMHISPSTPEFKQSIVDNLVQLNKLLRIKIIFSSSLKIAKIISFYLVL